MRGIDLFQLALNLKPPWEIVSVDFVEHDGKPDAVEESCCDMSPAFISGIGQYLPKSQITLDKFHVM
ncbi:transposase [Desulfocicer niacini]